jgi:septal ring factor EnvC (AmiA/AmiB activator)
MNLKDPDADYEPPEPFWHYWLCFAFALALLLGPALIRGGTRAWSQSSAPKSTDKPSASQTWRALLDEGQRLLNKQQTDSAALKREIEALKIGSAELTSLCAQLSQSNSALKTYNAQIGERMQARDEDLAAAYTRLDALTAQRRRLIAAVVILACALAGAAFCLLRFKK